MEIEEAAKALWDRLPDIEDDEEAVQAIASVIRLFSSPDREFIRQPYDEHDFEKWASVFPTFEQAARSAHGHLVDLSDYKGLDTKTSLLLNTAVFEPLNEYSQWMQLHLGVALHTIG